MNAMRADDAIKKIKNAKNLSYDEVLNLYREVKEFMNSDAPEEEKNKFRGIGYGEMLCMMIADEDK